MKDRPIAIFVSDRAWRLAVVRNQEFSFIDLPEAGERSPAQRAGNLRQLMAGGAISPGEIVLIVPSAWCMTAVLNDDTAAMERDALLFELEDKLPVVAENITADFLRGNGGKILGVCIEHARLTPVVDTLEALGWVISAICPVALLAFSQWAARPVGGAKVDAVLVSEDDQWVLLPVENGLPVGCLVFPAAVEDLRIRLKYFDRSGAPVNLLVDAALAGSKDSLEAIDGVSVTVSERSSPQTAAHGAAAALAGDSCLPIDLLAATRRGYLNLRVRRPRFIAAISCGIFLAAAGLALFVASWRMDRRVTLLREQQSQSFHQVVHDPRRPAPPQVYRYLTSELQRMTTTGDRSDSVATSGTAVQMLSDIVDRLPDRVPVQLDRLHVEPDRAELAGRVPSHEDAGRIANSLAGDGSLVTQPPQTSLGNDKTIDFILQVQRAAMTKEQQ